MARGRGSGETCGALLGEGESCFDKERGEKKGRKAQPVAWHIGQSIGARSKGLKQPRCLRGSLRAAPEQAQIMNFHFCIFIIAALSWRFTIRPP